LKYFHAYNLKNTYDAANGSMYDCEKDFKDSSWGVGVQTDVRCNSGARDEDEYCEPPVHRQRVRQTVAQMSRARETEHLSFRPVPA